MTNTTVRLKSLPNGSVLVSEIGPHSPAVKQHTIPRNRLLVYLRKIDMLEDDIENLVSAFNRSGDAIMSFVPVDRWRMK